eukprot:g571.t1
MHHTEELWNSLSDVGLDKPAPAPRSHERAATSAAALPIKSPLQQEMEHTLQLRPDEQFVPTPELCVRTERIAANTGEQRGPFYLNLCSAPQVAPPTARDGRPPTLSDDLASLTIPMSVGTLRRVKVQGHVAEACDVAVSPACLQRVRQGDVLFRTYLLQHALAHVEYDHYRKYTPPGRQKATPAHPAAAPEQVELHARYRDAPCQFAGSLPPKPHATPAGILRVEEAKLARASAAAALAAIEDEADGKQPKKPMEVKLPGRDGGDSDNGLKLVTSRKVVAKAASASSSSFSSFSSSSSSSSSSFFSSSSSSSAANVNALDRAAPPVVLPQRRERRKAQMFALPPVTLFPQDALAAAKPGPGGLLWQLRRDKGAVVAPGQVALLLRVALSLVSSSSQLRLRYSSSCVRLDSLSPLDPSGQTQLLVPRASISNLALSLASSFSSSSSPSVSPVTAFALAAAPKARFLRSQRRLTVHFCLAPVIGPAQGADTTLGEILGKTWSAQDSARRAQDSSTGKTGRLGKNDKSIAELNEPAGQEEEEEEDDENGEEDEDDDEDEDELPEVE